MFASYLESIKYVGHLWPVAFIRIAVGYRYLSLVVSRVQSGYQEHAYISEHLNLSNDFGYALGLYFDIFKGLIQGQWLLMTYILLGFEVIVGVSYILGFGVRLVSLLGLFLSTHIYFFFEPTVASSQSALMLLHLLFCMIGAGRCLGLDFYFYKSRRGLLW